MIQRPNRIEIIQVDLSVSLEASECVDACRAPSPERRRTVGATTIGDRVFVGLRAVLTDDPGPFPASLTAPDRR